MMSNYQRWGVDGQKMGMFGREKNEGRSNKFGF